MGWNEGGRVFEEQIIALYDAGLLTPGILDTIAAPFKETDCDTGGFRELESKDGLVAEMIICKVMDPEGYEDAIRHPTYPRKYLKDLDWKIADMTDVEKWHNNNKAYDLFRKIWSERWGIF